MKQMLPGLANPRQSGFQRLCCCAVTSNTAVLWCDGSITTSPPNIPKPMAPSSWLGVGLVDCVSMIVAWQSGLAVFQPLAVTEFWCSIMPSVYRVHFLPSFWHRNIRHWVTQLVPLTHYYSTMTGSCFPGFQQWVSPSSNWQWKGFNLGLLHPK